MRKTVTVYKPTECLHGTNSVAYPTPEAARRAIQAMPSWYPGGENIEAVPFDVPDDAFWTGDLMSAELHRGGYDDDDGIHHGGGWQPATPGLVRVLTVDLSRNTVDGYMFEPGTDRHIQTLLLKAGHAGYPYRNAKLLRANDVESYE